MDISNKGLIEVMSHEGVCLSPYLDSVGVWTIGVGITSHDGVDVRKMGTISIDQAIALFKDRIKAYVRPVQKLHFAKDLKQHQFDALVSLCYNFGPGNLAKLCNNRSIEQVGNAIMLYLIPPEITARRMKEQALFKHGKYGPGHVSVFPVSSTGRPIYSKGYRLDVSKYFTGGTIPSAPLPPKPAGPAKVPPQKAPPEGLSLAGIWEWLKNN